jgi:hypothetical protein
MWRAASTWLSGALLRETQWLRTHTPVSHGLMGGGLRPRNPPDGLLAEFEAEVASPETRDARGLDRPIVVAVDVDGLPPEFDSHVNIFHSSAETIVEIDVDATVPGLIALLRVGPERGKAFFEQDPSDERLRSAHFPGHRDAPFRIAVGIAWATQSVGEERSSLATRLWRTANSSLGSQIVGGLVVAAILAGVGALVRLLVG